MEIILVLCVYNVFLCFIVMCFITPINNCPAGTLKRLAFSFCNKFFVMFVTVSIILFKIVFISFTPFFHSFYNMVFVILRKGDFALFQSADKSILDIVHPVVNIERSHC